MAVANRSFCIVGRDLPGNIVAAAPGHGAWEFFVACAAVPCPAAAGDDDIGDSGDGPRGYVLMCINFVAECLERVGVKERGEGEGEGDGLVILLEGVGEAAVWEFVRVGSS